MVCWKRVALTTELDKLYKELPLEVSFLLVSELSAFPAIPARSNGSLQHGVDYNFKRRVV